MDYLTQQMNFGLSVEDTIDYDKWVREHPFDNPQAPDVSGDVPQLVPFPATNIYAGSGNGATERIQVRR